MKFRITLITLLAVLLLLASVGCQKAVGTANAQNAAETETAPSYATIGELQADQKISHEQWEYDDSYYVEVFEQDGVSYRAIASLTEELSEQLFGLDWEDPEHDEKQAALLAPIPIDRIENLTAQIPPQEELDKLVGKTGKELLDDGWNISGYNLDTMEFWMNKGLFNYTVIFDGKLEDSEDFYDYEAIQPLTVKSVTYSNVGDPMYMD